jgi:hypothetical protein
MDKDELCLRQKIDAESECLLALKSKVGRAQSSSEEAQIIEQIELLEEGVEELERQLQALIYHKHNSK